MGVYSFYDYFGEIRFFMSPISYLNSVYLADFLLDIIPNYFEKS